MRRFLPLLIALMGLMLGMAASASADGPAKQGVDMALSASPAQYIAQGVTPIDVSFQVSTNKPGTYTGKIAIGGSWWGGLIYPYQMSQNMRITWMSCDWWGCSLTWEATLEKNHKNAYMVIQTSANTLVGKHLVATAENDGQQVQLYVDAIAPTQ